MLWFRVDNRLVHGQVIEGWLPYVAARHLIVEIGRASCRERV